MEIRLTQDVPVHRRHDMTAGRVFEVVKIELEQKRGSGTAEGRTRGYWVKSGRDTAPVEQVLVLRHECEVVDDATEPT